MLKIYFINFFCFLILISTAYADDSKYPGRAIYPEVKYLSTDEFRQEYKQSVIVDARSSLEFEAIHILKAVRYSPYDDDFEKAISVLRADNPAKKIVFYCNGLTCMKSYKAAQMAMDTGIKNVYAYDSGVFEWAENHPDLAVLVGKTPIDVKQLLEQKSRFKQHVVPLKEFVNLVYTSDSIVLDVRNNKERYATSPLFMLKDRALSLKDPEKLKRKLKKLKSKGKPLLIYDATGRTVVWLEYYLVEMGIENYTFMKGGAYEYARVEINNHFFNEQPEKVKKINELFESDKQS